MIFPDNSCIYSYHVLVQHSSSWDSAKWEKLAALNYNDGHCRSYCNRTVKLLACLTTLSKLSLWLVYNDGLVVRIMKKL